MLRSCRATRVDLVAAAGETCPRRRVFHEREVMLDAVNARPHGRGLALVTVEDAAAADGLAAGHADYTTKFSPCCAELVNGAGG